jgi:similar to stage IV sporulation protein
MVKIDLFLFGWRKITVSDCDAAKCTSFLVKHGISTKISADGKFYIFDLTETDYKLFKNTLADKIEYTASEKMGVPAILSGLKYRIGALLGVLAGLLLVLYLSGLVFDVRITAHGDICETDVEKIISDAGLTVGKSWRKINIDEIENGVLSMSDGIGWISVNRRGTVLYVEVAPKEGVSIPSSPVVSGNIVATEAAVIEEITVNRGVAVVKPGDVVEKGALLISGVYENGKLCPAEGRVIGRVTDTVEATAFAKDTVRVLLGEELVEKRIEILGFKINILKNYGNLEDSCDIIEEKKDWTLFSRFNLPIKTVYTYGRNYGEKEVKYTKDEQVANASRIMADKIRAASVNQDLIRLRTEAEFTNLGYTVRSHMVLAKEIGEFLPFSGN